MSESLVHQLAVQLKLETELLEAELERTRQLNEDLNRERRLWRQRALNLGWHDKSVFEQVGFLAPSNGDGYKS